MTEIWGAIAGEFLHNYPNGARVIAVAGAEIDRSRLTADAVAEALASAGETVERADTAVVDASRLRTELVAPFRSERGGDRVLVVSGPDRLLAEGANTLWHYTLWQSAGDEPPHTAASALVDVTDAENPRRRYADSC